MRISLVLIVAIGFPGIASVARADEHDEDARPARASKRTAPPPESIEEQEEEERAERPRPRSPKLSADEIEEREQVETLKLDRPKQLRLRYLNRQIDGGKRVRLAGLATTIAGAVFLVVGAGVMVWATGLSYDQSKYLAGGASAVALGVVAMGVGIPLWIIGQVKASRYETQKEQLLFGLAATRDGWALQLRGSF
jgi:Flp pilus assembly protein TadB